METGDGIERRVAETAMRMAAERGWSRTGVIAVARASAVPLTIVYRRFSTRADLLAAVSRTADRDVLAGATAADADAGESARDRLFDVLMRRFDALLPYREGIAAVLRDLPREPLTAASFAMQYRRSMGWMLRAAGLDAESCRGAALSSALAALNFRVLRVWLADDTADLARTMAALDAELRRAESWAGTVFRRSGRPNAEPAAAGAV